MLIGLLMLPLTSLLDSAAVQAGAPAGMVRPSIRFLMSCKMSNTTELTCTPPVGAHSGVAVTLGLAFGWIVLLCAAVLGLGPLIWSGGMCNSINWYVCGTYNQNTIMLLSKYNRCCR